MNGKIIALIGGIIVVVIAVYAVITSTERNAVSFQPGDTLKVASTIFPLHDIVRTVAGENVESNVILSPGASPHLYQFTPSRIQDLEGTHLVFMIGHGLDEWVRDVEGALPGSRFVTVDNGITLREASDDHDHGHDEDEHGHEDEEEHHDEDEHGHEHEKEQDDHDEDDEHDHGPTDPHYWLSYANAKVITQNIADTLSDIDPANRSVYEENARTYIAELTEAERISKSKIAALTDPEMITFHDAWFYFAEDLGLEVVGTFEPSGAEEPTPRYLAELTEAIEEHDVSVLFSEPQLSHAGLDSFVGDNDLEIFVLDPLGGLEGRMSYIELMDYNTNEIVSAFSR